NAGGLSVLAVRISIGSIAVGNKQQTVPDVDLFNYLLIPQILLPIFIFIMLFVIKKTMKKSAVDVDKAKVSCGDFGIMVEGLPQNEKSAQNVFDHFSKLAPVHSVLLCYDCNKISKVQQKLDENVNDYNAQLRAYDSTLETLYHYAYNNLSPEERIVNISDIKDTKQKKINKLHQKRENVNQLNESKNSTGFYN
ncbi:MAG: hypothetical protein EZS28_046475, partial [Streblomastix strix]